MWKKSGILFQGVGSICPILPCIERLFSIWGIFEGVLVHPRPTGLLLYEVNYSSTNKLRLAMKFHVDVKL